MSDHVDNGSAEPGRAASQMPSNAQTPTGPVPVTGQSIAFTSAYRGPIPPPDMLRAYEELHPGMTAWILREAEKSTDHVRRMESLSIKGAARDAILYRLLPFLIVIALLTTSTLIAIFANSWLGGAGALATLASVVTVYLRNGHADAADDDGDPGRPDPGSTPSGE